MSTETRQGPEADKIDRLRILRSLSPEEWQQTVLIVGEWAKTQPPVVEERIILISERMKQLGYDASRVSNPADLLLLSAFALQAQKQLELEKPQQPVDLKPASPFLKIREKIAVKAKKAKEALERRVKMEEEKYSEGVREKVARINSLEKEFSKLTNDELREKTNEFKKRFQERLKEVAPNLQEEVESLRKQTIEETDGKKLGVLRQKLEEKEKKLIQAEKQVLDELLPEAFAAVRVAAQRTIGMRCFDCQIVGGIVLHDGKIAEMKTGEGKTLVTTLPAYLAALAGHGVHVVTPNDYLSKHGAKWMGPVYEALGISVGVIEGKQQQDDILPSYVFDSTYKGNDERYVTLRPSRRREAYQADVTYGTHSEFGFDYLRDNLIANPNARVQRGHHFAIVDEVDNVLIDEARTPLVLSDEGEEAGEEYQKAIGIVRQLEKAQNEDDENGDFYVDEKRRQAILTDKGVDKIEKLLGIPEGKQLYDEKGEYSTFVAYLENCLQAEYIFEKGVDYIVKNGEIIIIDKNTGREMHGRRFEGGLHQALEAKEGLKVKRANIIRASVTLQNYFRMYRRLSGMTGTATTEAEEFQQIYNLDVVEIPPNKPVIRRDENDLFFTTKEAKLKAVIEDVKDCLSRGQPVLLGTSSINSSQEISKLLQEAGIKHQVLNAIHHEEEAQIVANAGRSGTVTVATNMAGRGTDILLGGNPEVLTRERLKQQGKALITVSEEEWNEELEKTKIECAADRKKVLEAGGLRIIGTEHHEARRIDNQLRGRAGRQGDPGSSVFYISSEDDLMRRFGGDKIKQMTAWVKIDRNQPLKHPLLVKAVEQAQIRVEGYNFDVRKYVLEYDEVKNVQRRIFYQERDKILQAGTPIPIVLSLVSQSLEKAIENIFQLSLQRENGVAVSFNPNVFWQEIFKFNHLFITNTSTKQEEGIILPKESVQNLAARWQLQLEEADKKGDLEDNIKKLFPQIKAEIFDVIKAQFEIFEREWESLPGWPKEKIFEMIKYSLLATIDRNWVDYLTRLEDFQEGVNLRAFGQQNPLYVFKDTARKMFQDLNEENVIGGTNAVFDFIAELVFFAKQGKTFEQYLQEKEKRMRQQAAQEVMGG